MMRFGLEQLLRGQRAAAMAVVAALLVACGEGEPVKPGLASVDGAGASDAEPIGADATGEDVAADDQGDNLAEDTAPSDESAADVEELDEGTAADQVDPDIALPDAPSGEDADVPVLADETDAPLDNGDGADALVAEVGGADGASQDVVAADAAKDTAVGDAAPSECPDPAICDDKNPCTVDTCKKGNQCVWTVKTGGCEDGDPCTTGEACDFLQCVGGKPGDPKVICDDGNACTAETCQTAKGGCQHAPVTGPCNDGDPCTAGESCADGACKALKFGNTCDDGKGCTTDQCQPKTGACSWIAITGACDDGDACTVGDLCQGLNCAPGKPKFCPDGGPCADAGCDSKSGACYFKALPGADAKECDGTASEGQCFKAYKVNAAQAAAEQACAAWGGHLARIANPEQNSAARNQANAACGQGSNALIGFTDAAKEGAFVWPDGGPVTYTNWGANQPDNYQPGCAPAGSGEDATHLTAEGKWNDICAATALPCYVCSRPAPTIACAEPSQCLQGGVCVAGKCIGTKAGCDDGNPCTIDSCGSTGSCVNQPALDGTSCGNGQCGKGTCSKGGIASNPATSCAEAQASLGATGNPASSGGYWLDADGSGPGAPQLAWCEMASAGGGWTLVAVVSDDNQATFTWNDKGLWDTSAKTIGSLEALSKDYRSPLLAQLPVKEVMFSHVGGVWAQYKIGEGKQSFGQLVAATSGSYEGTKCYALNGNDGWPMVAGNLPSGGNLCNTNLYLNAADHDGQSGCGDNEHTWGPAWNVKGPAGCFDDPGEFGALGPIFAKPTSEGQNPPSIGFGWALGLNKGKAGAAQNWMRVYVR